MGGQPPTYAPNRFPHLCPPKGAPRPPGDGLVLVALADRVVVDVGVEALAAGLAVLPEGAHA